MYPEITSRRRWIIELAIGLIADVADDLVWLLMQDPLLHLILGIGLVMVSTVGIGTEQGDLTDRSTQ